MDGLSTRRAIEILLVEDNPGDARLTEELLRDGNIPTKVNHVRDGVQALAFLRREGAFREAPRPELILLDLNLPRIDGRELLAQIKRDKKLQAIPVVVLTGSANDGLTARYPEIQADCFMQKPVDAEKFLTIVRAIDAQNIEAKVSATTAGNAKARLLANLTHELRTRLNSIIGFSEMMELQIKGSLNTDYREYAHDIHESAVHLQRMIFDILDLSKIEMRRLTLNEGQFALPPAIETCLNSVREQAQAAEIKISSSAASNLPRLNGDEHLVKEMLINLLTNAITHGSGSDSLHVSTDISNTGGLFVSIKDTGFGIISDGSAKTPDPAAGATPGEADDPGVGLSLCRSIAELHGGCLEVLSEPGAGATVTVRFPASRTDSPDRKPGADAQIGLAAKRP